MTRIYKLEVFGGEDYDLVHIASTEGEYKLPMGIHDIDEDTLVLTIDYLYWRDQNGLVEQDDYARKIGKVLSKRVLIMNFPGAQDAKFLRLEETSSLPPRSRKPLYSRKLRLGRKHDIKDKEETDAKISEEKEEIPEEKTSTGVEEDTVGWRWPH